jgi:pimeloyl-ACP methyl ester carboxylesterase
MSWHYQQQGTGRPLILLHGIGMSHSAWKPVIPLLAKHRQVIAFDLPGFGRSMILPNGTVPNAHNIIKSLGLTLKAMGINEPVDFAGNSLGGYLALEAAKQGLARSVVALSPAGLWKQEAAAHVAPMFGIMRGALKTFPRVSYALMRLPPTRALLMAVPVSSQAWRMSAKDAVVAAKNFAHCKAFDETKDAIAPFVGGRDLKIPLTVAFGSRDWLLTPSNQHADELPKHTRWLNPKGWGHVPMWDNPNAVAQLILEGTK